MKATDIDWDLVNSQIVEMGRKISNLEKEIQTISEQYKLLSKERKDLEKQLTHMTGRLELLQDSSKEIESTITLLVKERNDLINQEVLIKFNAALLGKALEDLEEDSEYRQERIEGIDREIEIMLRNIYSDPDDLTVSQLNSIIETLAERIENTTKKLPVLEKKARGVKNQIRDSNAYIDRRILKRTKVVDLDIDTRTGTVWMTVVYHILQNRTKDVFCNVIYYVRTREKATGGHQWACLREHKTLTDKQIKSDRKLKELERLYEKAINEIGSQL